MVPARPSTTITRKIRLRSRWATAAAILIGCFASPIPAFQTAIPLHRQRTNFLIRRPTRQWTVTDPDILLREKIPRLSIDMAALEKAYSSSSDFEEISYFKQDEDAVETALLPQRTKKFDAPKKKDGRRSSTMPGFATRNSGQQQVFRDEIKIAEQRSGKKFVDTPEMKKNRRKQSNEVMYRTTASVPDSLVRFANEIHLVSDAHTN